VFGAAAALVLLVAGGVAWGREFAVTDPKLAEFARALLPEGAVVTAERGFHYQASNGWDRWYHPEDTAIELAYRIDGVPQSERLERFAAYGTRSGWTIERREEGAIDFSREGYHAIVRDLSDEQSVRCREQAKALGQSGEGCGGRVAVFAD
jgi:hypothetical protein